MRPVDTPRKTGSTVGMPTMSEPKRVMPNRKMALRPKHSSRRPMLMDTTKMVTPSGISASPIWTGCSARPRSVLDA
eukprot:3608002-Prymnesium_polylepis.1